MIEIVLNYFFSRSVSAVGGTQSIFKNPAGLSAYYSSILFSYDLRDSSYFYGLNFNGIGIFKSNNSTTFAISTKYRGLYLGMDYNDLERKLKPSLLYRPFSFISFGYYNDNYSITLRPFLKSFLEVSLDAFYRDTFYLNNTSIGVNYNGILAYVGYDFNRKNYNFGLNFAFNSLLIGASSDSNVVFEIPFRKFRSLLKSKKDIRVDVYSYIEDKVSPNMLLSSNSANFYEFISSIKSKLRKDEINRIILNLSKSNLSLSQIEELRNILKSSKKEVICYADFYDYKTYYLATACKKIVMNPNGYISFIGLYNKKRYFKELFDSLGIVPQVVYFEEYKSAVEQYIRNDASEYDREQRKRILSATYEKIKEDILEFRKVNLDSLFNYGIFVNSESAMKLKLIDTIAYENELFEKYKISKLENYISFNWKNQFRDKIALVFLEGPIVDQDLYFVFGRTTSIGLGVVKLLERLNKDKSVKAVVIRINSPGGSAFVSDLIANEIKKLSKNKLVIVSMSRVAGSGGYYISAYADKIFADNLTITGSIGIFGVYLATDGFLKKKSQINVDTFKIFKHSDAFSGRVLDSFELSALREEVKIGYDKFLSVVSEGRKIPIDSLKKIAKGRVWIGKDAKSIGLVDTIGGILDAINYARSKVKNAEIEIWTRKFKTDFSIFPLGMILRLFEHKLLYYNDLESFE
ncbi:MAG: signal peptide peptidase SppA [candidate division WOR-3 bacterium]|nr:signal peptide peptidase SppA [candidate division WOR-3 bacterium]MCX7947368.1 signal peptide peptidase SppA [candidate division WOR-3 bacterium]MDW8150076.1 signal peptide peptidase SppA [candidate division WOR-3 bacterium]